MKLNYEQFKHRMWQEAINRDMTKMEPWPEQIIGLWNGGALMRFERDGTPLPDFIERAEGAASLKRQYAENPKALREIEEWERETA